MKIDSRYSDGILYIRLNGEIDEYSARQARREADKLAETYFACKKVVFDLSGVSFMDSTGIGFLIGRYKKFRSGGVTAYVTNPSETTDKILAMSGVYTLIPRV